MGLTGGWTTVWKRKKGWGRAEGDPTPFDDRKTHREGGAGVSEGAVEARQRAGVLEGGGHGVGARLGGLSVRQKMNG